MENKFMDPWIITYDANLTMTVLLDVLVYWTNNYLQPPILYLQFDNCVRENKNRYMFALLALLDFWEGMRYFQSVIPLMMLIMNNFISICQMIHTVLFYNFYNQMPESKSRFPMPFFFLDKSKFSAC